MKKHLLLLLLLISPFGFAQAPSIQWKKCFGGSAFEEANCVEKTTDGGYMIIGDTQSSNGNVSGFHGINDIWIVKLDHSGIMQWEKAYGGTDFDFGKSIKQTPDGGYIVAGYTRSNDGDITANHGSYDSWVLKLDAVGTIQWQKTFGGTKGETAWSIQLTTDGGYIVAGSSSSNDGDVTGLHFTVNYFSDFWVFKINNVGTLLWQKTLGGTDVDQAYSIEQTSDGGFIVAGETISNDGDVTGHQSNEDENFWVVKLSNIGTLEWQKTLGSTGNDWSFSAQETNDGGYIVAGSACSGDGDVTNYHGGLSDGWIVKLSNTGGIEWQKTYGGTGLDTVYQIIQTVDGGYVMAGKVGSNDGDIAGFHGGNSDGWLLKIDSAGGIEWQKPMGGGSSFDYFKDVLQTSDGGYITVGGSDSFDGDLTGSGNHGGRDFWISKLGPSLATTTFEKNAFVLYPNPVSSLLYIECADLLSKTAVVYNVLGKSTDITINNNTIDVSQLPSGVYFLDVQDQHNKSWCQKFIKQ